MSFSRMSKVVMRNSPSVVTQICMVERTRQDRDFRRHKPFVVVHAFVVQIGTAQLKDLLRREAHKEAHRET